MTLSQPIIPDLENPSKSDSGPIRIPLGLQSDGSLFAFDIKTSHVHFASENIEKYVRKRPQHFLGTSIDTIFDSNLVHGIKNGIAQAQRANGRIGIGTFDINKRHTIVTMHISKNWAVVEFCPSIEPTLNPGKFINDTNALLDCLAYANSPMEIFEATVRALRFLSGYDRIVALQFVDENQVSLIAECKRTNLPPHDFLPSAEASAETYELKVGSKTPMSAMFDVDQVPIALVATNASVGELDISRCLLRSPSPAYKQHLFDKEAKASMSMPLHVDGIIWGALKFFHSQPKIPSYRVQEMLLIFRRFLEQKLSTELAKQDLQILYKERDSALGSEPVLSQSLSHS